MTNTQQSFLAAATQKAAESLAEAFANLPESKRLWSPAETARPATDQVAECTIINGYMANLLHVRQWPEGQFDRVFTEKAALAAMPWEEVHPRLLESAQRVAAAIFAVPDTDLLDEIETPWRKQTVAELITYPHWNMTYHQGQINYLASLLGPLN